jgi:hypothetical protein
MRKRGSVVRSGIVVGALALLTVEGSRPAVACGGFFCSQVPVDQSGEQIIFELGPEHVTTYVQIAYTGKAEDFSWVVPVPVKPDEIKLGSQSTFAALSQRTSPQFRIDFPTMGGRCVDYQPALAGNAGPTRTQEDGVNVLDSREVGPFDIKVLEAGDAKVLTDWLAVNGYDQPPTAAPLIAHYVRLGMLFVAVKLRKDAEAGEVQPLSFTSRTDEACVPLILTAVAAIADMPVVAYVLGGARAFPTNWFNVEPDYAKVNWFNGGSNYRQVAVAAIDEAAGRGFITEFAGKATIMKDVIFTEGRFALGKLATLTEPSAFIQELLNLGFPRDATMQALLRKHIPMPASLAAKGVTEQMFYNNIRQYSADLMGFMVDARAFIKDLEERIVTPMREAQAMFDRQPYLTRLLSLVSPDEMTRDPLFHLNPDMPDVSNLHVAKAAGMCLDDGKIAEFRLTLEDGEVLEFPEPINRFGQAWPFADKVPAAKRLSLVGTTGKPIYIKRAEVQAIDQMLNFMPVSVVRGRVVPDSTQDPETNKPGVITPEGPKGQAAGGGCAVARGTESPAWAALAMLGLVAALGSRRRGR